MKALIIKLLLAISLVSVGSLANADTLLERVQNSLLLRGYTPGNLIGQLDQATINEIARFQLDSGIQPADGRITTETLLALDPEIVQIYSDFDGRWDAITYRPVAQPVLPQRNPKRTVVSPKPTEPVGVFSWNGHCGLAISNSEASRALGNESSVSGGGGYLVGGAVGIHFAKSPWTIELGAGYRVENDSRDGVSTTLERFPVSLTAYRGNMRYRSGLGLVTHLSTNFRQDGVVDTTADSSLGYLVSFEYRFRRFKHFFTGARYENIDYDFSGRNATRVNGNNVAIYVGWSQF